MKVFVFMDYKKILIIRFSSIGDIILTEPVIKFIKITYPDSEIHYLTKPSFIELISLFNHIDQIYTWENKKILINTLKNNHYDLVIDLHNKFNSFLVKYLINPNKIVTYSKKHLLRSLIVKKISKISIDSTVKLYLSSFKTLNKKLFNEISVAESLPNTCFPTIQLSEGNKRVNEISENYNIPVSKTLIAIFPGATHFTKQYPIDLWINFINRIPNEWQCQIVLLGGHQEKYHASRIKTGCPNKTFDLCGVFSLKELAYFINMCSLVISNDSGPMHLTAALKKPQIALFGATHTCLGFKPLNDKAIIIQQNLNCQPCSLHGSSRCPKGHFWCMRSIKPEFLVDTLKESLEKFVWNI